MENVKCVNCGEAFELVNSDDKASLCAACAKDAEETAAVEEQRIINEQILKEHLDSEEDKKIQASFDEFDCTNLLMVANNAMGKFLGSLTQQERLRIGEQEEQTPGIFAKRVAGQSFTIAIEMMTTFKKIVSSLDVKKN